jgi:polyisoprenoid-binding protein YceI
MATRVGLKERKRWLACTALVFTLCSSYSVYGAENKNVREVDTVKSTMTVRVFKGGLFSAFGHNHEITAPIAEGSFSEESIRLRVDSSRLKVADRDVSDKDRAEIQSTMLGEKVLDSAKFPQIIFKSTGIERQAEGKWLVRGELTLHGETHPVTVHVEGEGGHYRGWVELKQKDFGMTPIVVAGGTVKVKDEVRVEFEIFGK